MKAIETNYEKLEADVARVDAKAAQLICVDEWSIWDLLIVRTRWAEMVVEWIEAGRGAVDLDLD